MPWLGWRPLTTPSPPCRPVGGAGRLVVVSGEAGIGKTLLTRFVADLDAAVAWGTCWDGTGAGVLAVDPGDPGAGEARPDIASAARRRSSPWSCPIRTFDPYGSQPPMTTPGWPCSTRSAIARPRRQSGPVVVVLDDLQWADHSTLDLLRYLTRMPVPGPVLLVGAHRTGEPDGAGPAALATLAALGEPVPLAGLPADDVQRPGRRDRGSRSCDRMDRRGAPP